jgi:preprotein translocase subunit SecD
LPDIYKNNIQTIDTAEIGKVYGLLTDTYMTVYEQSENSLVQGTGTDIEGFTMYRVVDRKEGKDLSGNMTTLYTIEDVFVQDRELWIPATHGQEVLNGAYFKFANTSTSEMGEPVVVINLDEKGKELFCTISEENIKKPMAIFV